MLFDGALHALSMVFEVFLLDLILSGDNALVIALACRGLPPEQMRRAVLIGTSGAIVLRALLTTLAGWLLLVPWLKLIGALLLLVIAIRLLTEEEASEEGDSSAGSPQTLGSAVVTVLTADLIMSMDNVVGLAAVAQGSVFYLVLGLLLSVPLLMFGSLQITRLLQRQPVLVSFGAALLGYVAGDIAVSDPVVVGWVNSQSPALNQVVPLLCAVYVVLQARIILRQRARLPKPVVVQPVARAVRFQQPDSEPVTLPVVKPEVVLTASPAPAIEASNDEPPRRLFGDYNGLALVLAGLAGIFVISAALYSLVSGLSGGLLPTPQKDYAYVCTGASTTLYYRPGGSTIRLVTGGGEASGYVRYKTILWQTPQSALKDLHLTLPGEIEKTSATVVTLNGGSFSQIQCARSL
ncbi:YjbE family putative metal transport protein [Pseudomonas helvetica]|uniref:YjbE family putative metal transport protein n=1 Tax=Pseudomonas helvetica TaxID=3136738 RepID=UPI0032635052